jgi:hypothetical protein
VTCGLPQIGFGGGEIEDVVEHLEGHAEGQPPLGDRVQRRPGQAPDQAADAAGGREQRGRLALDRAEVVGLGTVAVEGPAQLGHLALAQLSDGAGQQGGHLGAEGGGDLRRPGQQEIAGQDGGEVAPPVVHALDATARVGLVHDVVVVERAEVDELHRHTPQDDIVAGGGPGPPPRPCRPGGPRRRRV